MKDKSNFIRTVIADLKLGLKVPFILAILGVTLGYVFDNWMDLQISINNPLINNDESPICVLYYVYNSFSFGGVFTAYFSIIMAAIPFAANYCSEQDGGLSIYKISRCGCRAYVRSKFLVTSALGGMTVFLGCLLFMVILGTYLPIITLEKLHESQGIPFYHALTVGNGALYLVIILYISFLGGALWGSVGLWISGYFTSSYVAVCAPFLVRFVFVQVARILQLPDELRLDRMLSARVTILSDFVTLILTTAIVIVLILLCCHLFSKQVERNIWNVE